MNTNQTEFTAAIFDPEHAVPGSLIDGEARPAGKRFDVYRNNVMMSLKDALNDSFPVIAKLLGPANFSSLAGLYVRSHPPVDPRMMLYGEAFPGFLENTEALAHLGYLADVARLELAQRNSYHASDAIPFDPAIFSQLTPEALASAHVDFAPAVRLLRSPWPVLDIWHFNMTEGAAQPSAGSQDVLITRSEFDPEMHALPIGAADLIESLMNGALLGDALETVEAEHADFDFPSLLGLLIQTGALTRIAPTL